MPDPLRTVALPAYDRTLTLEPSKMFYKYPYAVMEQREDLKYFNKFFRTKQQANEYLDQIETEAKQCQEITTE